MPSPAFVTDRRATGEAVGLERKAVTGTRSRPENRNAVSKVSRALPFSILESWETEIPASRLSSSRVSPLDFRISRIFAEIVAVAK
jgi:hypothetical protein